jgi:uncharacterized protein (DUF488 family)
VPAKRPARKQTASAADDASPLTIFTIGHSTRSIDQFIRLLTAHGVERLVDIRTIPKSRHNPQFGRDQLVHALRRAGIRYTHAPGLGGLRHPRRDSPNTGWRNSGFRGYADYMQTPAFSRHLDRCLDLAKSARIALMCAEAVPWRCHRSLVADALIVRGVAVSEITSGVRARPHSLTPWAVVDGVQIAYPDSPAAQGSRR